MVELLVLFTNLNHWLPGSQVLSLLKHLQVFTTMLLLKSTSRQAVVPLAILDERCMLESEIISHFELLSVQITPSFAGLPKSSACKQKYVPLMDKVFWGVYLQASESVQDPNLNGSINDFLMIQRPVAEWKITLCGLASDRPGPALTSNTIRR